MSLAKVTSSASTLPPRPWWRSSVCRSRPWPTLRPLLLSPLTSLFHKGALWPSPLTDAPSTWCSRWRLAPVFFFPHRVFLVGVPGVKRGFLLLINLKMNGEQPHWLRQLYHSHQNLIVIPGSHWYREGSHQAGGETRWLGETGGEAEGEDVEEWLQGEGAIEGARAGCWEGEKRSFVLGCFFFEGVVHKVGTVAQDSTPFSLTAPAESNWTWKSERSCRELQENDVIVSPVIQHYAREEFVAMLLMSMLALTVIMYFFVFFRDLGPSCSVEGIKSLHGLYLQLLPSCGFCLAPLSHTQMSSDVCFSIFNRML